jgi:hypothetical protein
MRGRGFSKNFKTSTVIIAEQASEFPFGNERIRNQESGELEKLQNLTTRYRRGSYNSRLIKKPLKFLVFLFLSNDASRRYS